MDTTLLILVLTGACTFVFGLVLAFVIRLVLDKRAKHSESEATVAKWLEGRERQVDAVAKLRADVQRLSGEMANAKKGDGKDTVRMWERIKQLEDGLEWVYEHIDSLEEAVKEPAKPANSTNGRYAR